VSRRASRKAPARAPDPSPRSTSRLELVRCVPAIRRVSRAARSSRRSP
jgi:hypothetical protein